MLDAEELSPALRAKAGELQTAVAELDREIAAETAALKGRTAVGEWRSARQYLLDVDVHALWGESSVDAQREVLRALFSGIKATRDCLVFHVRGLEFPVEIAWQSRMSAESMVTGARTELSADIELEYRLVRV